MAKLGYTWYPKDWGNSESVFELNLSERGLYRELIDLAMLNDNKTEIKLDMWCRKFAVDIDSLKSILSKLILLNLVKINQGNNSEILFIPSCESRLNLVRGGAKGGKNSKPVSKPTLKPMLKPFESLEEKNVKPIAKQREREREIENKINSEFYNELLISDSWLEVNAKNNRVTPEKVKKYLNRFYTNLLAQGDKKNNKREFMSHFARWLPIELKKDIDDKPKITPLL